jgi:hypothetical protein
MEVPIVTKINKICAALIAASLLSTAPVWTAEQIASAKTNQVMSSSELTGMAKKAWEKMQELVPELKDFSNIRLVTDEDDEEEEAIEIHLQKNESEKYPYAIITLDPRQGEIVGFTIQDGKKQSKGADAETAKRSAAAFLDKLMGDDFADYQLMETGPESANVLYSRLINGIPFESAGISVFVGQDGKVKGFSQNMLGHSFKDKSVFPEPKDLIGEQAAVQAAANSLRLIYQVGAPSGTGAVLKYVPEIEGPVDAKTGKGIRTEKYSSPISVASGGKQLTAKTRQEAAEILKRELGVDVTGIPAEEDQQEKSGRFIWKDQKTSMYVLTNQRTGEVNAFGIQRFDRDGKPKLSKEEAQHTALKFLETYLHKDITAVQLREFDSAPGTDDLEDFVFHLSHQGIPVWEYQFRVTVDLSTGKVTALRGPFQQQPPKLPDSKEAVPLKTAQEEFIRTHQAVLAYTSVDGSGRKTAAPYLIYNIKAVTRGYIDAFTGKTVEPKKAE